MFASALRFRVEICLYLKLLQALRGISFGKACELGGSGNFLPSHVYASGRLLDISGVRVRQLFGSA